MRQNTMSERDKLPRHVAAPGCGRASARRGSHCGLVVIAVEHPTRTSRRRSARPRSRSACRSSPRAVRRSAARPAEKDASSASPRAGAEGRHREEDLPKDTRSRNDDPTACHAQPIETSPEGETVVAALGRPYEQSGVFGQRGDRSARMEAAPESPKRAVAPARASARPRAHRTSGERTGRPLDHHKRYPSRSRQQAAEIVVSFVLDGRPNHVVQSREGLAGGGGDARSIRPRSPGCKRPTRCRRPNAGAGVSPKKA